MRTRYCVGVTRASAASIMASLALLCVPTPSSAAEPVVSSTEAADDALSAGAGYGQPQGDSRVRALQRRLRALGYRPGPGDGLYGPRTKAAVELLQQDSGLPADGVVGPQTRRLLKAGAPPLAPGAGYARPGGSPRVREIQRRLRSLGSRPGPLDGVYGPRTEAAVERFQRSAGERASGVLSPATAAALARALSDQPTRAGDATGSDGRAGSPATASSTAGSDTSPTRTRSVADNHIDGSDEAGSTFPLKLVALAVALVASGGLLAIWFRRRPPRPEVSRATGGPVKPPRLPNGDGKVTSHGNGVAPPSTAEPRNGNGKAAKPRNGSRAPTHGAVALGYVSVRQPEPIEAPELREQMAAIDAACCKRGLELADVIRDLDRLESPGSDRPGMQHALKRLAAREASCLVVADLGRLSRSAPEVGEIVGLLREREARLVAVGDGLDTGTKRGGQAADELVSVGAAAAIRRRSAGGRQPDPAPKALKPVGTSRTSRPPRADDLELNERIRAMRARGMTLQAIADRLNAEKIPTLNGGTKWRPSAVQQATRRVNGSAAKGGRSRRPTSAARKGGGRP
jgi:peptidoglycan hydrolase-like protein with peptidoglycan-binding domain/DNA invertase Pin-like site-specific DNA recombinase